MAWYGIRLYAKYKGIFAAINTLSTPQNMAAGFLTRFTGYAMRLRAHHWHKNPVLIINMV